MRKRLIPATVAVASALAVALAVLTAADVTPVASVSRGGVPANVGESEPGGGGPAIEVPGPVPGETRIPDGGGGLDVPPPANADAAQAAARTWAAEMGESVERSGDCATKTIRELRDLETERSAREGRGMDATLFVAPEGLRVYVCPVALSSGVPAIVLLPAERSPIPVLAMWFNSAAVGIPGVVHP